MTSENSKDWAKARLDSIDQEILAIKEKIKSNQQRMDNIFAENIDRYHLHLMSLAVSDSDDDTDESDDDAEYTSDPEVEVDLDDTDEPEEGIEPKPETVFEF